MIVIRLREALETYRQRTGARLTYDSLAAQTGISVNTLQSLATRAGYNTRLTTVEKLCRALACTPGDLLELTGDDGERHDHR